VECAGADARVLVVERGNEIGKRLLVDEVIEERDADAPDDGLGMLEPPADRGQRGRSRTQQVPLRFLPAVRDPELPHPTVEVVARRHATHCRRRYAARSRDAIDFGAR
jgi:hypothetical protein